MVECLGQGAVSQLGSACLSAGISLVVVFSRRGAVRALWANFKTVEPKGISLLLRGAALGFGDPSTPPMHPWCSFKGGGPSNAPLPGHPTACTLLARPCCSSQLLLDFPGSCSYTVKGDGTWVAQGQKIAEKAGVAKN